MLIPNTISAIRKLCSKESTRYAFNGIHFCRKNGKAIAEATDGRRAIRVEWDEPDAKDFPQVFADAPVVCDGSQPPADGGKVDEFNTIIPSEAIDAACKATSKRNPMLAHFAIHEPSANGTVKVGAANAALYRSNVESIEGNFPPIDDVFPRRRVTLGIKYDETARFNRRAKLVPSEPKSNPAEFSVEIHVNPKLLAETLEAMHKATGSEVVRLTIPVVPNKPIMVESRSYDHKLPVRASALIMPCNPAAH